MPLPWPRSETRDKATRRALTTTATDIAARRYQQACQLPFPHTPLALGARAPAGCPAAKASARPDTTFPSSHSPLEPQPRPCRAAIKVEIAIAMAANYPSPKFAVTDPPSSNCFHSPLPADSSALPMKQVSRRTFNATGMPWSPSP